jgi:hypothetical protein
MKLIEGSSKESSSGHLLARYFAHGFLFSVLVLSIGLVWGVVLAGLIVFGSFLGLIVGFVLLFFIFGAINRFLVERIWKVPVDDYWIKLMVHGFVLFMALLVVSIPSFLVIFYSASLPAAAVLFIVYCFIDGYIGKVVGCHWEVVGDLGENDSDSERFREIGKV